MIDWKAFARWSHKVQGRAGCEWLYEVFNLWDVEELLDVLWEKAKENDPDQSVWSSYGNMLDSLYNVRGQIT